MRLLVDQDVYGTTIRFLRELGHDLVSVASIGLARAPDADLLDVAREQRRVLVTRDRDFGSLVFVEGLRTGVLYLRMMPATEKAVHEELKRVLDSYGERALTQAFVVIEPGRHRFRRLREMSREGDE